MTIMDVDTDGKTGKGTNKQNKDIVKIRKGTKRSFQQTGIKNQIKIKYMIEKVFVV
jgi:hypothetical protein